MSSAYTSSNNGYKGRGGERGEAADRGDRKKNGQRPYHGQQQPRQQTQQRHHHQPRHHSQPVATTNTTNTTDNIELLSAEEVSALVTEKNRLRAEMTRLQTEFEATDKKLTSYRRNLLAVGMSAEQALDSLTCAGCDQPLVAYESSTPGELASTLISAYNCFHQTEVQKSKQMCWHLLCINCCMAYKESCPSACPRCQAHIHGVENFEPTRKAVTRAFERHVLVCPYQDCESTMMSHSALLLHVATDHYGVAAKVPVVASRPGEMFFYGAASHQQMSGPSASTTTAASPAAVNGQWMAPSEDDSDYQ